MFVQIASIIAVSALALPQDSGTTRQPQPGQQGGQPGTAQGDKTRAEHARHKLMLQRSDKLVGMRIQDKSQANVAVIDDMILTPNGQISYAVLSGVEPENQGKLYVVPWSTLTVGSTAPPGQPPTPGQPGGMGSAATDAERATINIEREKLAKGPSFDRANWTKTSADREYFSQVDTYYAGSARGDTTGRPMEAGAALSANAIRGSQLRNAPILDAQGQTIGNISTVVFDPSGSRVNYIALTLTNPNGGGARTIAVPWEALRTTRPQGDPKADPAGKTAAGPAQLMLTTPVEKLQGAPAFETGDVGWKQMSDPKWVNDLYTYYSVRPYWTTASDKSGPQMPDNKPN